MNADDTRSLALDPSPCYGSWAGCNEIYTGGHLCEKDESHKGRCVCICGATSTKAKEYEDE